MQKENRKLIRVGTSSFAVIIPRGWIRYYDIKYGDKVEVITNGSVEIKPLKRTSEGGTS